MEIFAITKMIKKEKDIRKMNKKGVRVRIVKRLEKIYFDI